MMKQTGGDQALDTVVEQWGYPGKLSAVEEREWLMSLALDGELSPAAEARLNELLAADAGADEQWQIWQAFDAELAGAGSVDAPVGFAARVSEQLVLQERRRRLRTGALFALAAFTLWVTMLAALVGMGAFVWSNQVAWAGGALSTVTYWLATCGHLLDTLVNSLRTLLTAPEAQMVVGGYVVSAVMILLLWFGFLRRSLQSAPQAHR